MSVENFNHFSFMRNDEINEIIYEILISQIRRESHCTKMIKTHAIKKLIKATKEVLSKEGSLLTLNDPNNSFVVVGDIHGNIDDLIQVFQTFGYPPKQKYLLLGDYVDRGSNSVEVLILLYSLKIKYPNHIYLLRGNHETKSVSSSYGFKQECLNFYSKKIFKLFIESFRFLPIAATLNNAIFCVHGGLSPEADLLNVIEETEKPIEASSKVISDLLWSDPSNKVSNFCKSPRRSGNLFGSEAINKFLDENDFKMIIRAHEYCDNGFNCTVDKCLTIFSAIDYQGKSNKGAVAIVEDSHVTTFTFDKNPLHDSHGKLFTIPDWIFEEEIFLEPSSDDISISALLTDDMPVLI